MTSSAPDDQAVTIEAPCVATEVVVRRRSAEGEFTVLDGVSLRADRGQFVCVRGRSGSGKTTLLHVLAGLLRPDAGTVTCAGVDIWTLPESKRAELRRNEISMVLQDGGLIDTLTGIENVHLSLVGRRRGRSTRRLMFDAVDALDSVGVAHRRDSLPRQMSTGERQRVAFARALLGQPQLILVDEPTAALDRHSADGVIALAQRLTRERRVAMVVASHDSAVIEAADTVVSLTS